MITVQNIRDSAGRSTISYSDVALDRTYGWQLSLTSPDIPALFLNSKPEKRQLDVSIIEGEGLNPADHPDSVILPVSLVSTTVLGDKVKSFYRQRFDIQSKLSPILALDCFVTKGDEAAGDLKDPHILLCFKVNPMSDIDTNDTNNTAGSNESKFGEPVAIKGNDQSSDNTLDSRQQADTTNAPREHVDRGEPANGGLDLPVGATKSDSQEEQRKDAQFDYSNIDDKGKVGTTADTKQDA